MYNTKKNHFHFLGIGGIGMSGIATILRRQGHTISGCDLDGNQTSVAQLRSLGCTVFEGNNTQACQLNYDVLVYSSAIKGHNSEIITAQKKGIPTLSRALMLAELMRTKCSIAVAGSHGKTTTTSLLSHIFITAHYDPTVIVGGYLSSISSNAYLGTGDFLIAEADESDRSLTHLPATFALLTNIDFEHLETYRNLDDVKQTFKQFISNIPPHGKAFVCFDDEQVRSLFPVGYLSKVTFGIDHPADFNAVNITYNSDHSYFDVWHSPTHRCLGTIYLPIPGKHNILNALGALAVSYDLGISFDIIQQGLPHFKGVDRRFSYKGLFQGAELFEDYGHHPKEIYHTLLIARKRAKKRLIVLFQPHRYSRTQGLWKEFIEVFAQSSIDHLIITDIYSANEPPIPDISSLNLANELKQSCPYPIMYASYEPSFKAIISCISSILKTDDLLLILGAGKINQIVEKISPKRP